MQQIQGSGLYHNAGDTGRILGGNLQVTGADTFSYDFKPFFHPFIPQLINQLNQTSVAGMLEPGFLTGLIQGYTPSEPNPVSDPYTLSSPTVTIEPGQIDVSFGGPYANYNWELLYHIPVMVAVHLSNNQRFAEAQKWFHLVFDPTSTDTSVPPPERFWKSFVFRNRRADPEHQHADHPPERHRPGPGPGQGRRSSPATTRSWPARSTRTWSPAPGRARSSGTW